nr:zinc finger, CCHC-type [Tanacetum cinerariifolium]
MHSHTKQHLGAAKRTLCYIAGTKIFGIWYTNVPDFKLIGFTYSDWAGCLDTHKSTSGKMLSLGSCVTILKAYGIWETIVAKEGVTTNEKKENTSKAIIFQILPQDVLMQVAQYSTAKEVWDSIKVKHLGADLVQKTRLQTLRSELKTLRIKPNEKVLVRKLLNSVPKKFLPIVATIEQYQDLDEMSFEEAIERLIAYEERIKSQDTLEANGQNKLLMASSNNKTYGK